jgi:hypothetical protein
LLHHAPTVEVRQAHVEHDADRLALASQREALTARAADECLQAAGMDDRDELLREHRVVLDHEQVQLVGGERRSIVLGGPFRWRDARLVLGNTRGPQRQIAGEGAALSRHALDPEVAAQEVRRLPRYGEAQAGARVAPVRVRFELFERREHALLRIEWNAHSSIRNGERDDAARGRGHEQLPRSVLQRELDLALVGEFYGIPYQVGKDPLDALNVGRHRVRQPLFDLGDEHETLLGSERLEHSPRERDEPRELDLFEVHLLAACLDLREVQHLVDEAEQILAGSVDRLHVLDLLLGQIAALVLGEEL